MNLGNNTVLHEKQKSKEVTEDHLMQEATKLIELEDSHLEKQEQTDKTMGQREETETGKNERDMNENIWKRETIKQNQKASSQVGQVELIVKDGEDGPNSKCRPKRKKRKVQAQCTEEKEEMKEGQIRMKRPANFLHWESPKPKSQIIKENGPKKFAPFQRAHSHNLPAIELRLEDEDYEAMEEAPHVIDDLSAVAGNQPR